MWQKNYVENVTDMSSTCRRDMTMSPICRDTSRVSRHLMRGRHVIILKTCLDNVVTCRDVLTYCLCKPRSSNFFMTCRGDIQRHVLHVTRHVRLTDIWDPLVTCRVCDIINIATPDGCWETSDATGSHNSSLARGWQVESMDEHCRYGTKKAILK